MRSIINFIIIANLLLTLLFASIPNVYAESDAKSNDVIKVTISKLIKESNQLKHQEEAMWTKILATSSKKLTYKQISKEYQLLQLSEEKQTEDRAKVCKLRSTIELKISKLSEEYNLKAYVITNRINR